MEGADAALGLHGSGQTGSDLVADLKDSALAHAYLESLPHGLGILQEHTGAHLGAALHQRHHGHDAVAHGAAVGGVGSIHEDHGLAGGVVLRLFQDLIDAQQIGPVAVPVGEKLFRQQIGVFLGGLRILRDGADGGADVCHIQPGLHLEGGEVQQGAVADEAHAGVDDALEGLLQRGVAGGGNHHGDNGGCHVGGLTQQLAHAETGGAQAGLVVIHMGIGLVTADDVGVFQDLLGDVAVEVEGGGHDDLLPHQRADVLQIGAAGVIQGLGAAGAVEGDENAVQMTGGLDVILGALAQQLIDVIRHPAAGGAVQGDGGDGLAAGLLHGVDHAVEGADLPLAAVVGFLPLGVAVRRKDGQRHGDGIKGIGFLMEFADQYALFLHNEIPPVICSWRRTWA